MSNAAVKADTRDIVVEKVFADPPESLWKALTTGELMSRWLRMPMVGFEPVKGNRFTYQTTPAGKWDGVIHCEVLEVKPNERFSYSWKGGHESNVGYGAPLDTVVTFTLARVDGGTRLSLVHSGFVLPTNESAFKGMGDGWQKVVPTIGDIAGERH
jgi:uncharacterized protein YndB with AHSA1/START domain